jgi:CRP-like cAMP-binding protein
VSPSAPAPVVDLAFFSQVPIFAGLPEWVLIRVVRVARLVVLEDDQPLFGEGNQARSMFVVREGEVEILKQGRNGAEFCVAQLRVGDSVGEMSLVDIQPRSASARARGAARLYAFDQAQVAKLYETDVEAYALLVLNVARVLSRRLRAADQLLVDAGMAIEGLANIGAEDGDGGP